MFTVINHRPPGVVMEASRAQLLLSAVVKLIPIEPDAILPKTSLEIAIVHDILRWPGDRGKNEKASQQGQ
jgi:hypothetical protein